MILGIITAKGKSRGLPNKNIRPLLGKPTIYYTIEQAKQSKLLNKIVCSTEDLGITSIVEKYGVEVIKRPKRLAQDKTRIDDVLRHVVKVCEKKQGLKADGIVLLYGNIAVRKEGIIDEAIDKFIKTEADAVMTVEDIGQFHPNWLVKLDKSEKIELYAPSKIYRRQDLPKYYLPDGAVIVVKKEVLFRNDGIQLYPAFGKNIKAIVQDPKDVIDIDNEYDYLLAEAILKRRKNDKNSRQINK